MKLRSGTECATRVFKFENVVYCRLNSENRIAYVNDTMPDRFYTWQTVDQWIAERENSTRCQMAYQRMLEWRE